MLFISYLLTVSSIVFIQATRQLYTRLRIDEIKVISRGILGGKQVVKFANTRSRGRVCLFYQNTLFYQNDLIFTQEVHAVSGESPETVHEIIGLRDRLHRSCVGGIRSRSSLLPSELLQFG